MVQSLQRFESPDLERHAARRQQGIPTVSLVVGGHANEVLSWLRARHRRVFVLEENALSTLQDGIVHHAVQHELRGTIIDFAAAALGREPSSLRQELLEKTPRERALLLGPIHHPPTEKLLTELNPLDKDQLRKAAADGDLLPLLDAWWRGAWPAMFISCLPAHLEPELCEFVSRFPRVSVTTTIPPASAEALQRRHDRDAALLREGVVRVRWAPIPQSTLEISPSPVARSQEEVRLHRALQEISMTRGLFELNLREGVDFGQGPIEIDLACAELKIAVEIDGYHHFTDEVAYRRDRRKDVAMQKLGWLVVRVLANDVRSDIDGVLNAVIEVVRFRRKEME